MNKIEEFMLLHLDLLMLYQSFFFFWFISVKNNNHIFVC